MGELSILPTQKTCGSRETCGYLRKNGDCRRYFCHGCKRSVPWCFGACSGDEIADKLCDDCWSKLAAKRRS
jgi:hypothetical protein